MTITREGVEEALISLGVKIPTVVHEALQESQHLPMTEKDWDDLGWDFEAYEVADGEAPEKPKWPAVFKAWQAADIRNKKGSDYWRLRELHQPRHEITDRAALPALGAKIHIGTGIDHMTGLMHMVENATVAGATMPAVVLRDEKHEPRRVWTEAKVREVLNGATDRENRVESAHNVLIKKYHVLAAVRDDETRPIGDRHKAATDAHEFLANYEGHLRKAAAEFKPASLPTDLPTLKDVLGDRLEAVAMGRIKEIRGVKSQQGVDLPPSCDDKADALVEVSKQCDLGRIRINRANTTKKAKQAYDKAVAAIGKVNAANTPHWTVAGKKVDASHPDTQAVAGREVTFEARHPSGATIEGEPALKAGPVVTDTVTGERVPDYGWFPDTSGATVAGATVRLRPAPAHPNPVRIVVKAENLCGESVLIVDLDAVA